MEASKVAGTSVTVLDRHIREALGAKVVPIPLVPSPLGNFDDLEVADRTPDGSAATCGFDDIFVGVGFGRQTPPGQRPSGLAGSAK